MLQINLHPTYFRVRRYRSGPDTGTMDRFRQSNGNEHCKSKVDMILNVVGLELACLFVSHIVNH